MEELSKQRSPESSSDHEENDRQEQVVKEDTAATSTAHPKRSYECTFCKRGFTNAQALGGHMNIHRKDRAKNKQAPSGSSALLRKASEEYMNPSYMASISSERARYYYPVFETQRNYHTYFHQQSAAGPNPPQRHGYYHHGSDHFLVPRPQSLILNEEGLQGANLNLQIGSYNNIENSEMHSGAPKEDEDEDEVDLELRLGHDP